MKSSTKDKVEGTLKEATGKLKEKVGQAVDDPGCAIAELPRKSPGRSNGRGGRQESLRSVGFLEKVWIGCVFARGARRSCRRR
jgi:hypothetical protein